MDDFRKYAVHGCGLSSHTIDDYRTAQNAYLNPVILEERRLNVSQLDVFSRLMMDRILFLGTPIDDDVANIIEAQLLYLESTDSEAGINIYLNTPGGSVSAGLGIYDTMQLISPAVATTCVGLAASMGSVLLCAGEKGMRTVLPHSKVMIHQPLGGVQGQASDIEITAREISRVKAELYDILSTHTGKTVKTIERDADRDHWFSAQEAVNYGLADSILTRRTVTPDRK